MAVSGGPRLLGPDDEPQESGAVVAVRYGDYRRQEVWVRSGANVGNWYCLGGEFGRPKVWVDPRSELEKIGSWDPAPQPPAGYVPLHPHWEDVLARGPVVLLVSGDAQSYLRGWRAGRVHMHEDLSQYLENASYDDPERDRQEGDDG